MINVQRSEAKEPHRSPGGYLVRLIARENSGAGYLLLEIQIDFLLIQGSFALMRRKNILHRERLILPRASIEKRSRLRKRFITAMTPSIPTDYSYPQYLGTNNDAEKASCSGSTPIKLRLLIVRQHAIWPHQAYKSSLTPEEAERRFVKGKQKRADLVDLQAHYN